MSSPRVGWEQMTKLYLVLLGFCNVIRYDNFATVSKHYVHRLRKGFQDIREVREKFEIVAVWRDGKLSFWLVRLWHDLEEWLSG